MLLMLKDVWNAERKKGAVTILKKSQARLRNPDYVWMLLDFGHEIPRKYWPRNYKAKPIFRQTKTKFVKN